MFGYSFTDELTSTPKHSCCWTISSSPPPRSRILPVVLSLLARRSLYLITGSFSPSRYWPVVLSTSLLAPRSVSLLARRSLYLFTGLTRRSLHLVTGPSFSPSRYWPVGYLAAGPWHQHTLLLVPCPAICYFTPRKVSDHLLNSSLLHKTKLVLASRVFFFFFF